MTLLADLTDFQANGCNTYERIIIRATQMLLYLQNVKQSVESYAFKERVLLAVAWGKESRVSAEISFDLKNTALENKGIFAVKTFQPEEAFELDPLDIPPAELFANPYPNWVTDVENCIVWAGLSLNRPDFVTLKPDYKKGSLVFNASFPLDTEKLQATGGDLIASAKRINSDIPDYFA
jgi:hypothetical protein